MTKQLFIFGGASTALEIAEVAQRYYADKFKIFLVVPDGSTGEHEATIEQSAITDHLQDGDGQPGYILSMWNQQVRSSCQECATALNLNPVSIIHPGAYLSNTACIGAGVYIAAQSSVSTNARIHDHVVVNFNVTVGHDSVIGSHTFLNPGARISGHVTVGERVLIGANSIVFQGRQVADECLVD
ncbi:MAG: DapH/DapD/GlmU-related protein, partial [Planctomycetaceae bacterium]